jgi:hypothetical protein
MTRAMATLVRQRVDVCKENSLVVLAGALLKDKNCEGTGAQQGGDEACRHGHTQTRTMRKMRDIRNAR